jgi:hypothetical protein
MRELSFLKSLEMIFNKLKQFRQSTYTLLGKGKDAIFDLMDAVVTSPRVNSCAELSLSPVFRRARSAFGCWVAP